MTTKSIAMALGYVVLAPVIGGLLAGVDRVISARMQGRKGPPIMQPFFDVFKLLAKQYVTVNKFQSFYVAGFAIFTIVAGALFFAGGDLLLVIFALTVGGIFLVLGAYSANSPYSTIGADRELLQMMAYEPMVILAALGLFMVTKSFRVADILAFPKPLIEYLPAVFLGFLFILTIKFRKSPFDLSSSHHAHQELVRGLTTEFSGRALALIEVAHWYENVLLLGFVYLFVATNVWLGLAVCAAAYFLEVLIDNTYARLTWKPMVVWSWVVAGVFGVANIMVVHSLLK
jgi:formate hydrogenlyase subunit 4